MEIPRQQFLSSLPTIKAAIDECDFVSIDTELSGLHRTGKSKRIDTLSNRYAEYKEATERFIIIQFGLCTFKWDEPSGRFLAKPFNFYIFPTSMTGKIQPDRLFMTQAQAFDFLSKQSFDFNKWIYQGIPYLTKAEEEAYVTEALRKLNDDLPDIRVDEKEKTFLQDVMERIEKWVKDPNSTDDPDGVNITTKNSYQRRLVYQQVRNNFEGLTADGRSGFIRVMRLDEKQRKKRAQERERKVKKDCEGAVGFRKVIDMLSESRKLVVGHNMLLDICHVIAQFIQPLPDNVQDFKKLANSVFPYMVDTKYMCASATELRPLIGTTTSLDILRFETNRETFKNPRIDMHMEFPRYLNDKEHEAGYDAYITGLVFLKLHSYLEALANPPQPITPPPVDESKHEELVEKKTRGNQGGWDISDDEQKEDPRWLEDDDDDNKPGNNQEDVYNYGSIRYPLVDENGQPTAVLSRFINKVAMVRTGFECFDFINPEVIDTTGDAFHVACTSGDLPLSHVCDVFAQFGKSIVDPTSRESAFVIYEHSNMDSATLKETALQKLGTGFTVETAAEYLERQQ